MEIRTPHSAAFAPRPNAVKRRSDEVHELAVSTEDLRYLVEEWIEDGIARNQTNRTIGVKRDIGARVLWFLAYRDYHECSSFELRKFFVYLATAHAHPGGRWDNPRMTKPLRPATVLTYYAYLKSLFTFVVAETSLDDSPMKRVGRPESSHSQIQPFTLDQVNSLIEAAQISAYPRRNVALLALMFDSGLRASEVCGLTRADVDFRENICKVLGKGNKYRVVDIGRVARRALWQYLRDEPREPDEPIFLSRTGKALTRSGLLIVYRKLGRAAGLEVVRCSPHTMRHAFATMMAEGGTNVEVIQKMLGHSSIKTTEIYLSRSRANQKAAHRRSSPANLLKI